MQVMQVRFILLLSLLGSAVSDDYDDDSDCEDCERARARLNSVCGSQPTDNENIERYLQCICGMNEDFFDDYSDCIQDCRRFDLYEPRTDERQLRQLYCDMASDATSVLQVISTQTSNIPGLLAWNSATFTRGDASGQTSQANAQPSQTNAPTSQTNAPASQTNAPASQTNTANNNQAPANSASNGQGPMTNVANNQGDGRENTGSAQRNGSQNKRIDTILMLALALI
ncbi:hypothetical protein KGF56_000712 [Candida oxycetoniae]|uniref:Uncharacterized protein n=1 Tax=Candida oxycetoniae TaxID=497107 RepID=A0AAI9X052_9ASCO|nr:uncharacterized protein KGF56_000712 [Candida oxycetoniae]KAI3406580.1 hypothetical protein KGF56_000712 [Candida oxycetoniae]